MKIYYDKKTKFFVGAGNTSSEYKDRMNEVDFVNIHESVWIDFLNEKSGLDIKIIKGKLTAVQRKKEKKVEKSNSTVTNFEE